LIAIWALVALAVPAEAAKRIALVIGNAAYAHVTPLANPVNDANLMEKALKDAGFEVLRADNLNRPAMRKTIAAFASSLKQGVEASMFHYAGHGIEANGKNFLVPTRKHLNSKRDASVRWHDEAKWIASFKTQTTLTP
jgi:uncharacterized caspase-like protein